MADNTNILPSKTFTVDKIALAAMKAHDSGGRMIYLNYAGKPILLQTPPMAAPFGLSSFASNDTTGDVKYSFDLAFKNMDKSPMLTRFFDAIARFDKLVLATVLENSGQWLKKKYNSLEVIEALYTPCVKFPKDKVTGEVTDKYPPTFRVSVPFRDAKIACGVYDLAGNDVDLLEIDRNGGTKGSTVTCIVECTGVWIAGGKFGCTWRAKQLRLKATESLPPCAFMDVYDDDDGFDAPSAAASQAIAKVVLVEEEVDPVEEGGGDEDIETGVIDDNVPPPSEPAETETPEAPETPVEVVAPAAEARLATKTTKKTTQ